MLSGLGNAARVLECLLSMRDGLSLISSAACTQHASLPLVSVLGSQRQGILSYVVSETSSVGVLGIPEREPASLYEVGAIGKSHMLYTHVC